jgi:hypothetical protein
MGRNNRGDGLDKKEKVDKNMQYKYLGRMKG